MATSLLHSCPWWADLRSLFQFASESLECLHGQCACFDLELNGAPIFTDDSVLVRVVVRQQLTVRVADGAVHDAAPATPNSKAVLRMRLEDWAAIGTNCSRVRALWTQVCINEQVVILDATRGPAFLACTVATRQDETLQMVELFSGGFSGWSQAAWAIREMGYPISTSWLLDIEDNYDKPMQAQDRTTQIVRTAADLAEADFSGGPVAIFANIEHQWWHRAWIRAPPHLLVASPPCQPWSSAGQQSGLSSPDGRLVLLLAAICRVTQVPVVCLEEVQGFRSHPDFPTVLEAWKEAGYDCVSQQSLQLSEVAPTWRRRFFLIFCHVQHRHEAQLPLQVCQWQPHPRPSLAGQKAYFPILPAQLLKHCQLTEDLLSFYLDPWYLPPGHPQDHAAICRFRLCLPSQQSKCFMATYHRQHELPEGMLARSGLLCSLLKVGDGIRFFSAPEIASCHGALRPQFLPDCDQTAMTMLGNALATPQAAVVLAHALQLFLRPGHRPDPAAAAAYCVNRAINSGNSVLARVTGGWILVHVTEVGRIIASSHLRAQLEGLLQSAAASFYVLSLGFGREADFVEQARVHCSTHVSLAEAMRLLRLEVDEAPQGPMRARECCQIGVEELPAVPLQADIPRASVCSGPILLCTPTGIIIVQAGVPDWLQQLKWAFDKCRSFNLGVVCLTCFGERLTCVSKFPPVVFVATKADDLHFSAPSFSREQVRACRLRSEGGQLVLSVAAEHALTWWIQAPSHLLECLGWQLLSGDMPTEAGQQFQLSLQATGSTPPVPLCELRSYLRDLLFLAQLRHSTADAESLLLEPVLIQVVARSLGCLRLPAQMCVDKIEHMWRTACLAVDCWPNARVFSGPFPLRVESRLEDLVVSTEVFRKGRDRCLVLSVMPETRGGGSKDENLQLAKSRVAALLLDRGVPLPATTKSVEDLVPALGSSACLHAMSQQDPKDQWQLLSKSAHAVGRELPPGDNRTERAANRIQKAVRRKKLAQAETILAADFRLQEETWCGIDEQVVPVLDAIRPDCSGVVLLDRSEANPQDLALLTNMGSEALCIVIPGHCCPDVDTCAGRVSVPVVHRRTGQRHLIAACFHNVGATDIQPHFACSTSVTVDGTICCSFAMFQDEAPSDKHWQEAVQAPVRTVVELFRKSGVNQALANPWGRHFRLKGRPSQPHAADTFQFFAKVPSAGLRPVLQQSGFNGVYVVPRSWDRQLLAGWAVVWLSSNRPDVEKQALVVPEQHGLVRSRNKYGLRIPQPSFAKVFAQLKPGTEVPATIDVKCLYKLGPVPASARAEDVQSWAQQLSWQVKVLKALGPQFWLVGAATGPPAETALFNDQAVLLVPVRNRDTAPPVVQAGGPLPRSVARQATKGNDDTSDPWLVSDPWSAYRSSQSQGQSPAGVIPAKSADQQLTARVHEQDNKIAALEHGLKSLREECHEAQQQAAASKLQVLQDLQSVRSEVQTVGTGLRQQLQASLESMRNAQAQQDQQVSLGMAELKALILSTHENKKARHGQEGDDL